MELDLDLDTVIARLEARSSSVYPTELQGPHAAVSLVLRRSPGSTSDADILLIRRAEHPSDPWSGHMALPGGRHDPTDATLVHTAVRETQEEVALDLRLDGRLVRPLEPLPAVVRGHAIGLTIVPFVFALARDAPLVPNEEVAEVLWLSLGSLRRGEGAGTYRYVHDGKPIDLPCVRVGERVVWGITHRLLMMFLDVLGP